MVLYDTGERLLVPEFVNKLWRDALLDRHRLMYLLILSAEHGL